MKSITKCRALLFVALAVVVPGSGSASGYVWFESLETTDSNAYKNVTGLAAHEDVIYAAAYSVLVKYSANGGELWRREPVVPSPLAPAGGIYSVATDAAGVYVAGSALIEDAVSSYYQALVQKFDHSGNLLWTFIDDAVQGSETWALAVADAGIYTLSYRYPDGNTLRRLTPDGDILWSRSLGAGEFMRGLAVSDDAVYVASGDRVVVYDSNGNYLSDFGVPLRATDLAYYNGHLYLLGSELASPGYGTLARTDLEGEVAWQRSLAEFWPVGELAVTETGVLVAATLFDPRYREAPSAVVLHFDFYGIERQLWSHTGETVNDPGADFVQPGPIVATADGIYLGGIDPATPYSGGFVSRLAIQPRYWKVARVADANGNGAPELAALRTLPGTMTEVVVKDTVTGQTIRRVPFALPGALEIDVAGVLDMNGNGAAEVAVLFRKLNGQGIVQIRDATTGEWITQLAFVGADWDVKALVDLDLNSDRVSELGVLAQADDSQSVGVQIRNSVTGAQVKWVGLPVAFPEETVLDLASVQDANGNGFPELAALYNDDNAWGVARYVVVDVGSKRLINEGMTAQPSPPEPERKALALTGTRDQKIGVPRLAILHDKPHGQGVAEISNAASGVRMGTMFFVGPSWAVRDIASQDLDADGSSELSVLVEADDGSATAVQIKDLSTGNQVQWIGLPAN